jgi:hypothetical protein
MATDEFNRNERYESILARGEFKGESEYMQGEIRKYLADRRRWLKMKNEEALAYEAAALENATAGPSVQVLRHRKLLPEQFPEGTRVRRLSDKLQPLRAALAAVETDYYELRDKLDQTKEALKQFNLESVTDPLEYTNLVATLDFYKRKFNLIAPKFQKAQSNLSNTQITLQMAYGEYASMVDELNHIGPVDRPLREFDRLSDRAREAGRIAELEFLIDFTLRPSSELRPQTAAA